MNVAHGQIVAGRYRVERLLAVGGMGSIYLVRHVRTDEALALKLLHPAVLRDASAVERFLREARAPAQFASDHVARVTDADTAPELDDTPFYVMELLRGRDLQRIVSEDGALSIADALSYLKQVAHALDRAHQAGIVHRDLKPENVFIVDRDDGTRTVKLLDFGIARFNDRERGERSALATQAGYVMGTPAYMAPEQAVGEIEAIGPTTDVWSLGLLTFKVLVGTEFWAFEGTPDLYAKILAEPIPLASMRGSPHGPSFDAWLARCLERDPRARFASAGQAVAALVLALDGSSPNVPSSLPPVSSSPSVVASPPWHVRFAVPLGLAVAALICVVGIEIVSIYVLARRAMPIDAHGVVATSEVRPPSSSIVLPPANSVATAPTASNDAAAIHPSKAPARSKDIPPENNLTRDQRRRLEALQRLCDQGTFTASECSAKRASIVRATP